MSELVTQAAAIISAYVAGTSKDLIDDAARSSANDVRALAFRLYRRISHRTGGGVSESDIRQALDSAVADGEINTTDLAHVVEAGRTTTVTNNVIGSVHAETSVAGSTFNGTVHFGHS